MKLEINVFLNENSKTIKANANVLILLNEMYIKINKIAILEKDNHIWINLPNDKYEINREVKYFPYIVLSKDLEKEITTKVIEVYKFKTNNKQGKNNITVKKGMFGKKDIPWDTEL